jgi:hypothetical protein
VLEITAGHTDFLKSTVFVPVARANHFEQSLAIFAAVVLADKNQYTPNEMYIGQFPWRFRKTGNRSRF